MLKALGTFAMLLVFVGPAQAGEVLTPPAPQPHQGIVVEDPTGDDYAPGDEPEPILQVALDIFALLPSLL